MRAMGAIILFSLALVPFFSVADQKLSATSRLVQMGKSTDPQSLKLRLNDTSEDLDIRFMSAVALGQSNDKSARDFLIYIMQDGPPDLVAGAIVGLRKLEDPLSVPFLKAKVYETDNLSLQRLAISALQHIDGFQSENVLLEGAEDTQLASSVRASALLALRNMAHKNRISHPNYLARIRPLMRSEDADIRALSAILLADIEDESSISELVAAILNPQVSEYIRNRCEIAIQKITGIEFGFGEYGSEHPSAEIIARHRLNHWWHENQKQTLNGSLSSK